MVQNEEKKIALLHAISALLHGIFNLQLMKVQII